MDQEVAIVVQGTLNAAVAQFCFKTDGQVATIFICVGFYGIEAVFEQKRIVTLVAVVAFRKLIADTGFCTEVMNGEVRNTPAEVFYPHL